MDVYSITATTLFGESALDMLLKGGLQAEEKFGTTHYVKEIGNYEVLAYVKYKRLLEITLTLRNPTNMPVRYEDAPTFDLKSAVEETEFFVLLSSLAINIEGISFKMRDSVSEHLLENGWGNTVAKTYLTTKLDSEVSYLRPNDVPYWWFTDNTIIEDDEEVVDYLKKLERLGFEL